jgi:hypothetical protein
MASFASWIHQLPEIRRRLADLETPVVDRASIEKLFGVRRRRAIQLMHRFGGFQAGRTFLIDRNELIDALGRFDPADADREVSRRKKVVAEVERSKALFPARKVRISVPLRVLDNRMVDLPPTVQLQPGELRIEFHGTEDLLRQLFELSQSIVNDLERFQALCEMPVRRQATYSN